MIVVCMFSARAPAAPTTDRNAVIKVRALAIPSVLLPPPACVPVGFHTVLRVFVYLFFVLLCPYSPSAVFPSKFSPTSYH